MRSQMMKTILCIAAIAMLLPFSASAQLFDVTVTTKLQKLDQERRFTLDKFDSEIKTYIENAEWSQDRNLIDPMQINITISIEDFQTSYEDVYTARFHIITSSGFQKADKEWQFPYRINQPMNFNPTLFEPITGLINFYIYIIIAEELDKYSPYGGDEYFQKASQTVNMGKSDRYSKYYDRRAEWLRTYLRENHRPYRNMTSWFYAAEYWTSENDAKEAKPAVEACLGLIKTVMNDSYEQDFIVEFFRRNFKRLAVVFLPYDIMYDEIMVLDPERVEFYTNFRKLNKK